MESRFIFAILSAITAWLYNFSLKVTAERSYNPSLFSIYSYISFSFFSLIYYFLYSFINWFHIDNLYYLIILAFSNTLFFFGSILSRIDALKNIHTVIFYPIYKVFWPIMVTMLSYYFFKETLEFREIIWIVIGIIVPILLITRSEWKIQKNLKKWISLVFLTAVLSTIATWFSKEAISSWYTPMILILFVSFWGIIFSFFSYRFSFNSKKKANSYNTKWIYKFGFITWLLHFLSTYTFFSAIKWNLAIVFTINSFSILVPIILSIIFYKEHFNLKKAIVIVLSIVSILLFI